MTGTGKTPDTAAKTLKVVVVHTYRFFDLWSAPEWVRERMERDFPQASVVQLENLQQASSEITDTDVFVGSVLEPRLFASAHRLKWIHSPAVGVHQLMFPELVRSDVRVTNSRDVQGPIVAEHAIACVLALAKRIPQCVRYQARAEWAQQTLWNEYPRPREVAGSTVVVVGMGSIGREFAARAKALGMKVLAVREDPSKGANVADAVYGTDGLPGLLPEADFVLLCTPVTPSTTRLMNRDMIERMKSDAYVINVGRGALIDEAAIIEALREKRLGGAALDVFDREPLPPDSPFWSLENVLVTPHTAAASERLWEGHYALIKENLTRFLDGRPLLNQVNKTLGY